MRFLRGRESEREKRRWSRRLVDVETRDFIDGFLDETRDVFRRASGEFDLRGLTEDVFSSRPTTDVEWLRERGVDAGDFYLRELAPNWEGLSQGERAAKIEQFMRLSNSFGPVHANGDPHDTIVDMVATVHTKVLLLAWAYDRTYSFIDRIVGNPAQFGSDANGNGNGSPEGVRSLRGASLDTGPGPLSRLDTGPGPLSSSPEGVRDLRGA